MKALNRFGFPLALLILAFALATVGLRLVETINLDSEPFDQSAYIGMSKTLKHSLLPGFTDGTRNPLFPWLAAKFADPHASDFFAAGKRLNVWLAVLGVVAIGFAARASLGAHGAWNLAALSGLGCLLPMSTFFGAEVLFYLFFLGLWISALRQIQSPSPMLGLAIGLFAGLAYLAKPSTGPFLGALTGFLILLILTKLLWKSCPEGLLPKNWKTLTVLVALGLTWVSYLVVISPRLVSSKQTFGSAFYSLPSFWFWVDDWDTCVRKYANCTPGALAQMTPEDQPTAANYFRRHSPSEAFARLISGTGHKLRQLVMPDGKWPWAGERKSKPRTMILPARGWYLVFAGLMTLALVFATRGTPLREPGGLAVFLFASGVFTLYTLAYGWYHVIGPGARFVMMFYIPLLWSFFAVSFSSVKTPLTKGAWIGFQALLSLLLVWRLGELLSHPAFSKISHAF
jgi:hypothetical protein